MKLHKFNDIVFIKQNQFILIKTNLDIMDLMLCTLKMVVIQFKRV